MIQGLLGKKTVAGVLCAFNKAIDDLRQVEVEQEQEAARQAQNIIDAQAAHDAAIKEAAMAREVSSKLTDLVKPVMPELGIAALVEEQ